MQQKRVVKHMLDGYVLCPFIDQGVVLSYDKQSVATASLSADAVRDLINWLLSPAGEPWRKKHVTAKSFGPEVAEAVVDRAIVEDSVRFDVLVTEHEAFLKASMSRSAFGAFVEASAEVPALEQVHRQLLKFVTRLLYSGSAETIVFHPSLEDWIG